MFKFPVGALISFKPAVNAFCRVAEHDTERDQYVLARVPDEASFRQDRTEVEATYQLPSLKESNAAFKQEFPDK